MRVSLTILASAFVFLGCFESRHGEEATRNVVSKVELKKLLVEARLVSASNGANIKDVQGMVAELDRQGHLSKLRVYGKDAISFNPNFEKWIADSVFDAGIQNEIAIVLRRAEDDYALIDFGGGYSKTSSIRSKW